MKNLTGILSYILVVGLLVLPVSGKAQDSTQHSSATRPYVGVFGGAQFTNNSAALSDVVGTLQLLPDVDPYSGEAGSGFTAGILFGMPLSDGMYGVELRAGFSSQDNELQTTEDRLILVPDGNGGTTPVMGTFTHTLETQHTAISLHPNIWIKPFGQAHISVGPQFSFVNSVQFSQIHEFPEEGSPVVPGQDGVLLESEFPQASSMRTHLVFDAGWEVFLNEDQGLSLQPEVSYAIPMSQNLEQEDWQTSWFGAGVALKYRFPEATQPLYDTLYLRDTTTTETYEAALAAERVNVELQLQTPTTTFVEAENTYLTTVRQSYTKVIQRPLPELNVSVSAFGITKEQQRVPLSNIQVTEYVDVKYTPLLNYILFDENQSTLPQRYVRLDPTARDGYSLNTLHNISTLGQYYNVLNIVGYRLTQQADATITLTGCNAQSREEENNLDLSRKRAEAVKTYLVDAWGINASRIAIRARNLPRRESNRSKEEGMEENRRVEIESSHSDILAPVFTSDTTWSSDLVQLEFVPDVVSEGRVVSWMVDVSAGDRSVLSRSGDGAIPTSITMPVDAELLGEQGADRVLVSLGYSLRVSDEFERTGESELANIDITKLTMKDRIASQQAAFAVENYSLLLFEFNDVQLNNANREIIDFIKDRMHPEAELTIVGVTDSLGEADWNRTLSERRAQAVAQLFEGAKLDVVGAGEDTRTYPNELPEGRIYSRTVFITVRNPIQ